MGEVSTGSTIATAAEAVRLLAVVGAAVLVLGLPMRLGLVRRNALWGVRTPTSIASDHNWRVMNRAAGRVATSWGVAMLALAGVTWSLVPEGLNELVYNFLVAVPALAFVLHLGVVTVRSGRPLRDSPSVRRWNGGTGPTADGRGGDRPRQ